MCQKIFRICNDPTIILSQSNLSQFTIDIKKVNLPRDLISDFLSYDVIEVTFYGMSFLHIINFESNCWIHQVIIAQRLARLLATGEVLGSNPGKEENLLKSDLKGKFN